MTPERSSLVAIVAMLLRRWRVVARFTGAAIAIGLVLCFALPQEWKATATLVPVESSGIGFGAIPADAAGLLSGLDLLGGQASIQQLVPMLRSRRLLVPVVGDFDLARRYDADPPETAWSLLAELISVDFDEAGGLLVSVTDAEPDTAALLVNRLVGDLAELNETLRQGSASLRRAYLEDRLDRAIGDLEAAADSLRAFQEHHRVLSVEDEARAQVEMIGVLVGQMITIDVEREVLEGTSGPDHPRVQQLGRTIEALRAEIASLAGTSTDLPDTKVAGILPRLSELPQLGQDYYRRIRELGAHEKVFELLVQQLELARMNEEWEAPVFQVLDEAVPPPLRAFPKRRSLMVLVTALGLAGGLGLAVAVELAERTRALASAATAQGRDAAALLDAAATLPLVGGAIDRWRGGDSGMDVAADPGEGAGPSSGAG